MVLCYMGRSNRAVLHLYKVWKSIGEMKADVFKFSPELDHFPKSPHRHIWDGVSIHISSAVQRAAEELQCWVQFRSNNFLYV